MSFGEGWKASPSATRSRGRVILAFDETNSLTPVRLLEKMVMYEISDLFNLLEQQLPAVRHLVNSTGALY
jgi:hypothetical protein